MWSVAFEYFLASNVPRPKIGQTPTYAHLPKQLGSILLRLTEHFVQKRAA